MHTVHPVVQQRANFTEILHRQVQHRDEKTTASFQKLFSRQRGLTHGKPSD